MARRLIDISVPLQNDVPADPPGIRPDRVPRSPAEPAADASSSFDGLKAEDLPDGEGWAMETVQLLDP